LTRHAVSWLAKCKIKQKEQHVLLLFRSENGD